MKQRKPRRTQGWNRQMDDFMKDHLEAYLAGELTAREQSLWEARVKADPKLARQVALIEDSAKLSTSCGLRRTRSGRRSRDFTLAYADGSTSRSKSPSGWCFSNRCSCAAWPSPR